MTDTDKLRGIFEVINGIAYTPREKLKLIKQILDSKGEN